MSENHDWLSPELTIGVDRLVENLDVPPNPRLSREQALQMIVRDWLQGQGYVPLPDGGRVIPVTAASKTINDV